MKKLIYLATALCLVAGAVSCKKNTTVQDPDNPQPTGEFKTVKVYAGQGSQKTSISAGNLTWSDGDKIYVVPQAGGFDPAALDITSGVGSASGTFEGKVDAGISDDTNLYSYCGGDWTYNDGTFSVAMPATQTYVANGIAENAYPSFGTGTIGTVISFKNPFGVLRVNVKGFISGKVESVTVTSVAHNLYGSFTVNPSDLAISGGTGKSVTINCPEGGIEIGDGAELAFNMVMPAFTFAANDLTARVTMVGGSYYDNIIKDEVVIDGNHVTKIYAQNGNLCEGITKVMGTVNVSCGSATQEYKTVTIGTQVWFAENLRCATYSNSSSATIDAALKGTTLGTSPAVSQYAYYFDGTSFGYGYYYSWAAAVGTSDGYAQTSSYVGNRQGICPDGWHVPTLDEYMTLKDFVEKGRGEFTAGMRLKADEGWAAQAGSYNLDCFGWYGLPGGAVTGSSMGGEPGYFGRFWTATTNKKDRSQHCYLTYNSDELIDENYSKNSALSIRCLRDTAAE